MARRHLALLRGINVGGKNRLPMEALRAFFAAAGCTDVETYIQSGNVVFRAPERKLKGLAREIQAAIEAGVGIKVPVVLRSGDELAEVAKKHLLAKGADAATLHVVFLADAPDAAAVKALDANRSPPDTFVVKGREVFLCCPKGYGNSKLTNAWFDSKLSTVSTVRNWRTVQELAALSGAEE
jgi:uncharacterized protein (DUF1697 family)